MKLYAPKYYDDFKCIADKCTHSCCIGWEIDIDDTTLSKYEKSKHYYAKKVLESIENSDTPRFKLSCDDRCPHLNSKGLCEIIINMGEDYLCDICREHPRFYNFTNYGKEVGIGMSCPEACRIILNSDDYNEFDVIARGIGDTDRIDYDALVDREKIYSILKSNGSFNDKLNIICKEYQIDLNAITEKTYLECIDSLEYLNSQHISLFFEFSLDTTVSKETEKYLERFLAYLVYRHCTESMDLDDFKISLSFCLFCVSLLVSMTQNNKDIYECARIISEEIEYSTDNIERIKELFY